MGGQQSGNGKLYEVRGSEIHGRGLYAAKDISKDTWIIQYIGEKISKKESDRRANELLARTASNGGARVYIFILNKRWDIDGDVPDNDARLMNHSCGPNVEAQIWDKKEIWFIALRDIKKGEELTFNYGFDLEHWQDHRCRCGSARCVGYIVDEDLWPELQRTIASSQKEEDKKGSKNGKSRPDGGGKRAVKVKKGKKMAKSA